MQEGRAEGEGGGGREGGGAEEFEGLWKRRLAD